VPRAPNLVAVEVMLGRFNPPFADTLALRVLEDSVGGGAFVAEVSRLVTAGTSYAWQRFDLPAPVQVVPGTPYVIELDATNSALGWMHQYELPPRCAYSDGEELVEGEPVAGLDASFPHLHALRRRRARFRRDLRRRQPDRHRRLHERLHPMRRPYRERSGGVRRRQSRRRRRLRRELHDHGVRQRHRDGGGDV
jgi:hypothetical protein